MTKLRSYEGIELLRLISIVGVVWFHTKGLPLKEVAYSGLVSFIVISLVLTGIYQSRNTFTEICGKKARRLLLPWAIWFGIYLLLNLIGGKRPLPSDLDLASTILAGPWIGLWFLPFLFFASLIGWYCCQKSRGFRSPIFYWTFFFLGIGTLLGADYLRNFGISVPWAQWIHAIPAIPFSICLVLLINRDASWRWYLMLCAGPVFYTVFSKNSDPGLGIPYLIAIPFAHIAFRMKFKLPNFLLSVSSAVMGVYLVHGITLAIFSRLSLVNHSPYLIFLSTLASAFFISFLIGRSRIAQFLF